MSLRWRIAIALGLLAGLATITVGVASYRITRDRVYAEIDRSLSDALAVLRVDRGGVARLPDRGAWQVFEAQVLGPDGTVRLTTMSVPIEPTDPAVATVGTRQVVYSTTSVDGTEYRVRTSGLPNGALQVARPLEETDRLLQGLRNRLVLLVVLITAAAAMIGFVIAGGVTASLRRLTRTAETVGATGRLDVEVPTAGSDEVGRLGTAFAGMLAALRRSREEQRRLVQDAGHELRTPITALRTNIDVLRRYPDLPGDQRSQVLDDLHAETEELVELVNEIVAAASGAADDEPVSTVALASIAEEVAERHERRTGRSVRVGVVGEPVLVAAQPLAVQRAVSNLIDNAHKFDPTGGPIEVEVAGPSLVVRDRGPGIPEAELAQVFDRFHRADEARTLPGSGLGLSIVRAVVERNGGTVRAANRDGGGAEVGFTLRAALVPPPPLTELSTEPPTGLTVEPDDVGVDLDGVARSSDRAGGAAETQEGR
ncbi:MAG: ATP-binding protein [Ilumatobacteraceae bacterium]|jgi:two-component system sensor histidine kinase MprB|nr:ATP-binding protein [Ilumatobacteraceae bacterium]